MTEVGATAQVVDTESATTGGSLQAQEIKGLPLVNRNYYELLSLTTGTTSDLNQGGKTLGRGVTDVQVSGQRTSSVSYQIEGVTVNDIESPSTDRIALPNPDFLQEFKVSTSVYDAAQGRSGGAVNATIKSGTARWHGDLFHFLRNDNLNANDVFLKAQGQETPVMIENQFGGALGGKVPIGGIFFFSGYQGWRQRNGLVGGISTAIPVLPASRTADTLGAAFGIAPSRIDPVALGVLNLQSDRFGGPFLIPTVPGTPGTVAPFAVSRAGQFRSDQGVLRLDRQWNNQMLFGTFFIDDWATVLPIGSGFSAPAAEDNRNIFSAITWTSVLGPKSTNQLRAGYSRLVNAATTDPIGTIDQIGMNSPNAAAFPGIPQFVIPGFLDLGNSDTGANRIQNVYQLNDDFTHLIGGHALRFGVSANQYRFGRVVVSFGVGRMDFGSRIDPVTSQQLNAMQSFLIGLPSTVRLALDPPLGFGSNLDYRATDFAFYFHDDWAVTRRLKLNLGLRMEALEMWWDAKAYRISVFDIDDYASGGIGFQLPEDFDQGGVTGTAGVKRCGVDDCRQWEWGPRVGFAYDLLGSGNTVIRGGYGMYYHRVSQQPVLLASGSVPFGTATGFSSNLVGLTNGFSVVPNPPALVFTQRPQFNALTANVCRGGNCFTFPSGWASPNPLATDFHFPRVHMWNFMIGQRLPKEFGFEIGYVGSKGTSLVNRRNPNQPIEVSPQNPLTVFGTTLTTNTVNNMWLRAPLLGLDPGRFRVADNSGNSTYHSLQTSVRRRLAPFLFQLGYTFSKSIDINSQGGAHTDRLFRAGEAEELSLIGAIHDQSDLNFQRAVSDFDRTHRLTFSYVVDVPTPGFARDSAIGRAVFGGWSASGITVYQSGTPYTVFDSGGAAAFGGGPQGFTRVTANSVGTPTPDNSNPTQYLDPSQFLPTGLAPGGGAGDTDWGGLGRNSFRSPYQQNWDFSVLKNFRIKESQVVEFRTSIFNIWNHPVFDVPDNGFSDVRNISATRLAQGLPQQNFGVARSTVAQARIIQFGLRYSF